MMKDDELNMMERQLAAFESGQAEHQRNLESIVSKYATLLEDYRTLKSDLEEEKTNRERYKRLARGQDRNPFVLVLVDGNRYLFKDKLVKNKLEGGKHAADVLEKSLKAIMPDIEDDCSIVVKVFVDLASISKVLAKADLAGKESRSFSWFASAFTRSRDHFEFVDTGDAEGTRIKIRETFRMFVDSTQCKKIVFAACHDTSHFQLLNPYRKRSERIVLVRSAFWAPEFERMDLKIAEFSSVFRSTPLQDAPPTDTKAEPVNNRPVEPVNHEANNNPPKPNKLRSGLNGHSMHAPRSSPPSPVVPTPSKIESPLFPEATQPVVPSGPPSSKFRSPSPSRPSRVPFDIASQLPTPDMKNMIPLNAEGKRIDTFLEKPTSWAWESFNSRVRRRKVCNDHQLGGVTGGCPKGSSCAFDHSPLTDDQYLALRNIVREYPCPRKGFCRLAGCFAGHICVKEGCIKPGGGCKLKAAMHGINPVVSEWVEPDPVPEHFGIATNKNLSSSATMDWRERREIDRSSTGSETRDQEIYGNPSPDNSMNLPERRTHDDEAAWSQAESVDNTHRLSRPSSPPFNDNEERNHTIHPRDQDDTVDNSVTLKYEEEDEEDTRRRAEEEIFGADEAPSQSEAQEPRQEDSQREEIREEEFQREEQIEAEQQFDTQSQHEMSLNFNSEDHMIEDNGWQATLASSTVKSNGNSHGGWGNANDNGNQGGSNNNNNSGGGGGGWGQDDTDWSLPVNTNTKQVAAAGGGGWGDHADGTWDTQGWADEPPSATSTRRQAPPIDFSTETLTWEGESGPSAYDDGYHGHQQQYHQGYQQPMRGRGGSHRAGGSGGGGGSRGGRGGHGPPHQRGGGRGGRGGYVPPHQRSRGGGQY